MGLAHDKIPKTFHTSKLTLYNPMFHCMHDADLVDEHGLLDKDMLQQQQLILTQQQMSNIQLYPKSRDHVNMYFNIMCKYNIIKNHFICQVHTFVFIKELVNV